MPFSCAYCEVKCTPRSVSKVSQLRVQSVTMLGGNKKNVDFFGQQNLFHVIYPRSNGPLKNFHK